MYNDGEIMGMRKFIKYCEENGYNSVKFQVMQGDKPVCSGKALDIYYEMVTIPVIGEEHFVRLSDLEDQFGYNIGFRILTEEEYKTLVAFDFIIRGKEVPQKYNLCD